MVAAQQVVGSDNWENTRELLATLVSMIESERGLEDLKDDADGARKRIEADEEMNLKKFLIDPARNFSRVLILPGPAAQQELEQRVGQQEPASIDQLLKEWKL